MSMAMREVSQTRGANRPHDSQRARRRLQRTCFIWQAMMLMVGEFEDKARLWVRFGGSMPPSIYHRLATCSLDQR